MSLIDARGGHDEHDSKERAKLLRLLHSLHLPRTATSLPQRQRQTWSAQQTGAVAGTGVQSAFAQRRVPVASRPTQPLLHLASLNLTCEMSAPDSEEGEQQDRVCHV